MRNKAISALNRFGIGARPGESEGLADPVRWLVAQLEPGQGEHFAGLPSSADYLARELAYLRGRRQERAAAAATSDEADVANRFRSEFRSDLQGELAARYRHALGTPAGFAERLVRFWSNHFAVSVDKFAALLYAAPMEREAIRPNIAGRFEQLLLAAVAHPAMLRYLDNAQSIGPGSAFATRRAGRGRALGLNENLAREVLELHTLGVDGGYRQEDVQELARALTGWSTPAPLDERLGARRLQREPLGRHGAVFRGVAHEPGPRKVLGKTYAEGGMAQAAAILGDLARHPATARHLSTKLARHFVADEPPAELVHALTSSWLETDGDLAAVVQTLVSHPGSWSPQARKFKSPDDFLISALRALDLRELGQPRRLLGLLDRMGQPPFNPRSPAGFSDSAAAWTGADALFKRMQVAEALAALAPREASPLARAEGVLGESLDPETRRAIGGSESPAQGFALLLASPAFQWRT